MTTLCAGAMLVGHADSNVSQNPLLAQWNTPFGVPDFEKIKISDFEPAFEATIKMQQDEINAITVSSKAPNFENTILALDNSGAMLDRTMAIFANLSASDMTPELEAIQEPVSNMLTNHESNMMLNEKLFSRIKFVQQHADSLTLDPLQRRLVDKFYKEFVRSGANLSPQDKERLRGIDQKLAAQSIAFGRNVRNDNNNFVLEITDKAQLAGLPATTLAAALAEGTTRQADGRTKAKGDLWVFTLDKASMIPLLENSSNAQLRKTIYMGYLARADHDDQNDNKQIIDSIVNLRIERANLMGFQNHASFVLDNAMAKTPEAVYSLLTELWTPALVRAKDERDQLAKLKQADGLGNTIEPWDWWYYSEKLKNSKYKLDAAALRPYFSLPNVLDGMFNLTTKLYGLTFRPLESMPRYNTENKVYEVLEKDGSHLGVIYFDFHPRATKGVGAWCDTFRPQSYSTDGKRVAPVVTIVCNFTKPVGDEPALLNLDEAETLYHEFGHGLHFLMQDVPYRALAGVEHDFVELPSQIMENWTFEPQVLRTYAKHYKTGKIIPDSLINKIQQSALFNQGFNTVEYLGASLLDMDYHTINQTGKVDARLFEQAMSTKYGFMPEIAPRYRSTYFQHIFAGGYSSGYYAYIWAEVLDADAYQAFVQSGDIYNPKIAKAFRDNILSKGGTSDGNTLYRNFRGTEPSKKPLMKKRGLI